MIRRFKCSQCYRLFDLQNTSILSFEKRKKTHPVRKGRGIGACGTGHGGNILISRAERRDKRAFAEGMVKKYAMMR